VWLPWWSRAPEGANEFYRLAEDGETVKYDPERLATISEGDVDRVLSALPVPQAESRSERSAAERDDGRREWRARALAALPLDQVYGDLLTSKRRPDGWLECRDPWSPTGDRDPSAGVAETTPQAERGSFHSFISGKTLSVFDFLVERGTVATIRESFQLVGKLSNIDLPTPSRKGAEAKNEDGLPSIQVNGRQLIDVVAEARSAVRQANRKPFVFVRSGRLAQIVRTGQGVTVEPLDEDGAYGLLARVAHWHRVNDKGDRIDCSPSKDAARDILAYPDLELPGLEAVVAVPVFASSGALISRKGYDRNERLWYEPPRGFRIGTVPAQPTRSEADAARDLILHELLADFPFAADSDQAHALAAILLPFVRRQIRGCSPIHLIEASTPGSGKGLLADVISLIAEGHPCQATTITRDETETRKKLTALLLRGGSVILIDNVREALDSEQLASALTAEIWSDRHLGQTRMIDLPNRTTWLVTANNPRLSLEIARRCVRIRLDPKMDKPWQREGFRHDPLRGWVLENRSELIRAVLILVRSWMAAGCPRGKKVLGSFEDWAYVMGGILDHAGVPGFLGSQDELYELADAEGQEWREFVAAWWKEHGSEWVRVKQLLEIAEREDLLPLTRGAKGERSERIRVGLKLSQLRGRLLGTCRIEAGTDAHGKAARYRIVLAEEAEAHRQEGDGDEPEPWDAP
jgi:hypothetical protein